MKTAARVDELKQTSQLLPILKTFSQEGVLTSVETYYPEVARECLKAGAQVFTAVFAALGKNDMIRTHEVAKVKALLETLSCL